MTTGSCAKCELYVCACRTGKTRITVGASSVEEGETIAEAYLQRRGWTGSLLTVKVRHSKTGMLGYKAWTLTYRVVRP